MVSGLLLPSSFLRMVSFSDLRRSGNSNLLEYSFFANFALGLVVCSKCTRLVVHTLFDMENDAVGPRFLGFEGDNVS